MNTFDLFGTVGTGEYAADIEDTLLKSGETYLVSFTKEQSQTSVAVVSKRITNPLWQTDGSLSHDLI